MGGWKLISEESGPSALQAARVIRRYVDGDIARMRLAGYPISERRYARPINNAIDEMVNGADLYETWRFSRGLMVLNELLKFHRLFGKFPTHHFVVQGFGQPPKDNRTKTYAILINSYENQNPEFVLPV